SITLPPVRLVGISVPRVRAGDLWEYMAFGGVFTPPNAIFVQAATSLRTLGLSLGTLPFRAKSIDSTLPKPARGCEMYRCILVRCQIFRIGRAQVELCVREPDGYTRGVTLDTGHDSDRAESGARPPQPSHRGPGRNHRCRTRAQEGSEDREAQSTADECCRAQAAE